MSAPAEAALDALRSALGDGLRSCALDGGTLRLQVAPDALHQAALHLRDADGLRFDYPGDLFAWDTGERFVVVYRLWSTTLSQTALLRVELERDGAAVASVTDIWPGMNWHEREVYDLYGIEIVGHPDAGDPTRMRILLPKDWDGFPFRKDYVPVFSGDPLHGPQETN